MTSRTPSREVRAVIVAGGRGVRFGGALPKQFSLLAGTPVINHAARAIAALPSIAEIVLVLPEGDLPKAVDDSLAQLHREFKAVALARITGGNRRQDSVARGLRALSGPSSVVLVHDAARPFPPLEGMKNLIAKTVELGAGILALRATDTIKQADGEGRVAATLDRAGIWLAQTPQAFRGDLVGPLLSLLESEQEFTDESAALEALGVPVALVEGAESNFKITRPEDLARAEAFLKSR